MNQILSEPKNIYSSIGKWIESLKVVDTVVHRDLEDPMTVAERFRDRYVTNVDTLTHHELEMIQDVDALTRFMRQHGDKIAANTLETYRPLYDLKPTETELAVLESLGKARKALPGRCKSGFRRKPGRI